MPDGAIVTDSHDYIVEINDAGADVLGTEPSRVLGRPLQEIAPDDSLLPADGSVATRRSFKSPHDGRLYDVTATAITDIHDRTIGHVITFHDISEHVRQQQRHEVLNRVFRHNIRTETNVISSYAELLADGDDQGAADEITASARRIEELGSKPAKSSTSSNEGGTRSKPSRSSRSSRTASRSSGRSIQTLASIVSRIWGDIRRSVLEPVFVNLIENGIEHNTGPNPSVRVAVELDGDRVQIRIADNGSGIDDYERSILERGTETPLEHGSGLGLWLAKWGPKSPAVR